MKGCEKGRDKKRSGRGRRVWTTHKGEEKEAVIETRREEKRERERGRRYR